MQKKYKTILKTLVVSTIVASVFLFIFGANFALAQETDLGFKYVNNTGLQTYQKSGGLMSLLVNTVRYFLGFLGIIAVIMVMFSGFLWMTSNGDEAKINKAKQTLVRAGIGLALMLSAFAIVTFIYNIINNKPMNTGGSGGGGGGSPTSGIGALGNCTIESVYPSPNQKDVPRNTPIIVTFKEEINPTTICNDAEGNNDGLCDSGEYIIDEHIRIYKKTSGDACPSPCAGNELAVNVSTTDNKTFIFTPTVSLGSSNEFIDYVVYLSNDITTSDGRNVFNNCLNDFFRWQFEVNNTVDLIPPRVKDDGVFPAPDNAVDTFSSGPAVQASGQISVDNVPTPYVPASLISVVPSEDTVIVDPNSIVSGILTITVLSDGVTAQLSQGTTLLGASVFSDNTINFSNILSLTTSVPPSAGSSWTINISAMQAADTLRIGAVNYRFVNTSPNDNEIQIGDTTTLTVANIADVIDSQSDISAYFVGNIVTVSSSIAGIVGNNIAFSANSANLTLTPDSGHLEGGVDSSVQITVNDKKDKPRNSVIQIIFNEAISPLTVSGGAAQVEDAIAIECISINGAPCQISDPGVYACTYGMCLEGNFTQSNQYRTVEFVSNNLCGVNGCGEKIYCLPGNSELKVHLNAATLDGCVNCSAKPPFTACTGGHCYNSATSENYPLSASPLDAIADVAFNSFDGNRSGTSSGPTASDYNENDGTGTGDNFIWSFFISNELDINPPIITVVQPAHDSDNVPIAEPITIRFNKLMMHSSLRTGITSIFNGQKNVKHRLINLINMGGRALGYWITNRNIDTDLIPDNEGDLTETTIEHADLIQGASYRAQVGSGVKDIYQNCYKPSSGPECDAIDTNPSCCPSGANISPTTVSSGDSCP